MDDWWAGIRIAVQRLDDAGKLAPGWTVDAATDWVWASVHPTTYHHLVEQRGWSATDAADRITRSLTRELLADPPPQTSPTTANADTRHGLDEADGGCRVVARCQ